LWYHSVFSLLLCVVMVAIILVQQDMSTLLIVGAVLIYVSGNTLLHFRRHDFHKESLYEYLIVAAAVLIVLWGAVRH
jgi:hypothetical protein